jgi:Na+-translocating ferredoxin:NAD+ oxidoreductase RnfG subunit
MQNSFSTCRWRAWFLQLARVGLLVLILLLIHREHAHVLAVARAAGLDDVPAPLLQQLFPGATELGGVSEHGGRLAVDADGAVLGEVLQTFPDAERFLGFSGPTNMLIGVDPAGNCAGLAILSSRDTRDHVQLIRENTRFLKAFDGKPIDAVAEARVDAVSGATLTSLAILQGVRARLGKPASSLKFPEPLTLEEARSLFPEAVSVAADEQARGLWRVTGTAGRQLGWILVNSPAADETIGYQGPTRAFLGADLSGTIIGMIIDGSYDNEPYVGYVRQNDWFRSIFNGQDLDRLGSRPEEADEIEGVSGATMTSQAVAQGLLLAAAQIRQQQEQAGRHQAQARSGRWRLVTTLGILLLGLLVAFTPLRGKTWFRRPYQLLLFVWLGLINGDLLSMAMFVGWAHNGIPIQNAFGLVALTMAALIVPIAARRNVYCDHLCPHGAIQQLLPRRFRLRRHPRWLLRLLALLRPALLALVIVAAFGVVRLELVDIEPFDAYAWRAAGAATISVAVVGLGFALLIPMGYCRYGCPTGAVLGYLRRNSRSDRLSPADGLAVVLVLLAGGLSLL